MRMRAVDYRRHMHLCQLLSYCIKSQPFVLTQLFFLFILKKKKKKKKQKKNPN
jgi:hypothetical protein